MKNISNERLIKYTNKSILNQRTKQRVKVDTSCEWRCIISWRDSMHRIHGNNTQHNTFYWKRRSTHHCRWIDEGNRGLYSTLDYLGLSTNGYTWSHKVNQIIKQRRKKTAAGAVV